MVEVLKNILLFILMLLKGRDFYVNTHTLSFYVFLQAILLPSHLLSTIQAIHTLNLHCQVNDALKSLINERSSPHPSSHAFLKSPT